MKKAVYLLLGLALIGNSASSHAQNLNWTNDTGVPNVTDVYTGNSRPGVTSTLWNNQIWVAYTSTTCSTGCAIKLTHSSSPLGTLSFSTPVFVSVPGVGNITSYNSPSLTSVTAVNGFLYLAYNDASNNNWLISTSDGLSWSAPIALATGYTTTWAPSLSADPNNVNRLYVGYADASTYTPLICAIYTNTGVQTCLNFTALNQMNFNPGIIAWNQTNLGIVMAYEWRGNTHCLYGYILNPETGYSDDYNASQNCSDQSSVAPSLAALSSGSLWLAFGGNNSNRQFNVRFTDDDELDFIYKHTFNQGMNGSPDLLAIPPIGSAPEQLDNFYVWNGQMRYLSGTY